MGLPNDGLDGCDIDFAADPLADDDIDAFALFADIDPDDEAAVAERRAQWRDLFG